MPIAFLEVLVGVVILSRAGDDFVEGAVGLATSVRLSPVLVGAVIIGFGTSVPEMVVSGIAAYNGDLDLGVGNVVGSNVANLSLVLAVAALIVPVLVTRAVLAREAPTAVLAVILFAYLASDGLSTTDGIILLMCLALVLVWVVGGARDDRHVTAGSDGSGVWRHAGRTGVGLAGTVAGAQLLVWGAMAVASRLGLTGGFIGFTLVAAGTSVPELATAVIAARKKQTDLILGNLLGSNVFNSLAVGGLIAVISPGAIRSEGLRTVGLMTMVGVTILAWVAMVTRRRVHRLEGAVLVVCWVAAVVGLASVE